MHHNVLWKEEWQPAAGRKRVFANLAVHEIVASSPRGALDLLAVEPAPSGKNSIPPEALHNGILGAHPKYDGAGFCNILCFFRRKFYGAGFCNILYYNAL